MWAVPLTASTLDGTPAPLGGGDSELVLKERSASVPKPAGPVKLNPGQTGFFRVVYSPELMASLSAATGDMSLPVEDRLGLVSDAYALAKAGLAGTQEVRAACDVSAGRVPAVWGGGGR